MKLLDTEPPAGENDDGFDAVAVIADALRAKFGHEALRVASLQCDHAVPESAAQWSEVVRRLS